MKRHIIIGASSAGLGALNVLRQLDPTSEIICLTKEPYLPYNRCVLADCLSGKKEYPAVYLRTPDYFKEKRITFLAEHTALAIDTEAKEVICTNGVRIPFDTLLIAAGLEPRIPLPTDLTASDGYFQFYGLNGLLALEQFIKKARCKTAIVIGAGLTGLECADALQLRSIEVTLVDPLSRVVHSLATPLISAEIEQALVHKGIMWLPERRVIQIEKTDNGLVATLHNGERLLADSIIAATGGVFQPGLVKTTGIDFLAEGIIVKKNLETSHHGIFAAGDCALVYDHLRGTNLPSRLWPDAMQQGAVAASNMAGIYKEYNGSRQIASSCFFDKHFVSGGLMLQADLSFCAQEDRISYGIHFEGKKLLAACGFGSASLCRQLMRSLNSDTIPSFLQDR